jgi:hypothetical protein
MIFPLVALLLRLLQSVLIVLGFQKVVVFLFGE